MVEKRITLSLPKSCRWLSPKIISSSPDVKARVSPEDRNLKFSTGLFRRREHIGFQALVEIPLREDKSNQKLPSLSRLLSNNLEISHRIADTSDIKKRGMPDISERKEIFHMSLAFPILMAIAAILSLGLGIFSDVNPFERGILNYSITLDTGEIIEAKVIPKADGTLLIRGLDGKFIETIRADTFFNKYHFEPIITPSYAQRQLAYVILVILSISIIFAFLAFMRIKQAKKIRQILSLIDNGIAPGVRCSRP